MVNIDDYRKVCPMCGSRETWTVRKWGNRGKKSGFCDRCELRMVDDPTLKYLCPNWKVGHKTCAKHRMWLKDEVCLGCQVAHGRWEAEE